jgi:hypothetical protein
MTDDAERTRHYRALAAQMRAKAYAETDPERRAFQLQLAASYVEIAEAWERVMASPLNNTSDSRKF